MSYNSRTYNYRNNSSMDDGRQGLLDNDPEDPAMASIHRSNQLAVAATDVQEQTLANLRADKEALLAGRGKVQNIDEDLVIASERIGTLECIRRKQIALNVCLCLQATLAVVLFVVVYFRLQ
eukprot:TRINITY_DN6804_c0_g1_i1.p1 TRINITY_DN6804_c0_g1~~TRINITY_DN6804_c0_g1_i1.p1  ORF type:complete len:122 (+),score=22.56 TRINITY_DN6804_c0_g1_i1:84-449(+)